MKERRVKSYCKIRLHKAYFVTFTHGDLYLLNNKNIIKKNECFVHNIKKYLKDYNKKDSIWCNPFITFDLSREETNKYYETFVKCNPHMIKKLTELLSLDVGLYHGEWNFTENYIHNEILLKISPLYKERI